jgi:hypothetical protein
VCDSGEREQRGWMELRWRDALSSEEATWRHDCVVGRVSNVKMIFYNSGVCESDSLGGWHAAVVWI